jgi:hypothetical protein
MGSGAVALSVGAAGCGGASHHAPAAPSRPLSAEQRLNLGVTAIDAVIGGDHVRSSGIVIDGNRGLVLTSAHSIWGATSLRLTTGVALVYLALIQTQPQIPGLASLRPASGTAGLAGDQLRAVGRSSPQPDAGAVGMINIPLVPNRTARKAQARGVEFPRAQEAKQLPAGLVPAASGGPVLDRASRVVGMAVAGDEGPAFAVPWTRIQQLLRQLHAGPQQVYVGWRSQYRCVARLSRYTKASHPGFKPLDARLTAPVAATRLPGTAKDMEGG